MATFDEVRRIALGFPGAVEKESGYGMGPQWRVAPKGALFVWARPLGTKDAADLVALGGPIPGGDIVAVRVEDEGVKSALIAEDPEVFFTIPHFEGFTAVLIRLDGIGAQRLEELVTESWLLHAPKRTAKTWLAEHPSS